VIVAVYAPRFIHGSYMLPWIGARAPAAIILDTGADGVNETALCCEITASSDTPVFVLTQSDSETD